MDEFPIHHLAGMFKDKNLRMGLWSLELSRALRCWVNYALEERQSPLMDQMWLPREVELELLLPMGQHRLVKDLAIVWAQSSRRASLWLTKCPYH